MPHSSSFYYLNFCSSDNVCCNIICLTCPSVINVSLYTKHKRHTQIYNIKYNNITYYYCKRQVGTDKDWPNASYFNSSRGNISYLENWVFIIDSMLYKWTAVGLASVLYFAWSYFFHLYLFL